MEVKIICQILVHRFPEEVFVVLYCTRKNGCAVLRSASDNVANP
jgi:hypothetical protein